MFGAWCGSQGRGRKCCTNIFSPQWCCSDKNVHKFQLEIKISNWCKLRLCTCERQWRQSLWSHREEVTSKATRNTSWSAFHENPSSEQETDFGSSRTSAAESLCFVFTRNRQRDGVIDDSGWVWDLTSVISIVLRCYIMNREDARERLYGIDFDCSLVEVVPLLVNVWGERRRWLCLLAALKGFAVPIPSDIERLIPGRGSTHCLNPHSLLNVIAKIKWRNARWNYGVEVGRERSGWFLKQHIISHLYSYSALAYRRNCRVWFNPIDFHALLLKQE